MYLAQTIRRQRVSRTGRPIWIGWQVWTFRVEITNDRPVWKRDSVAEYTFTDKAQARRQRNKEYPLFPTLTIGKLVSKSEAKWLTGVDHPMAALDYLTENANQSEEVQNYRKPPKVRPKKEPPTPTQLAQAEAVRAEEKVAEYDRRISRLQTLRAKWEKRAKRYAARAVRLAEAE